MPRDYKNTSRKKQQDKSIPGWVWFVAGLTVGLLIAFLVYIDANAPINERFFSQPSHTKKSERKEEKSSLASSTRNTLKQLKYEFYTLLPESEVVIPEHELSERIERMKKGKGHKKPEDYLLQAGSFKTQTQAESLKAKLALAGIESNIQTVSIGDDTWFRVRIGPFHNLVEISETRSRLREQNINVILVKTKK